MCITLSVILKIENSAIFEVLNSYNFFNKAFELIRSGKNYVAFVDNSFQDNFNRLLFFNEQLSPSNGSVVFILVNERVKEFNIQAKHFFDTLNLSNVAGILPGKSRPDEYVIFSAHYDHLGIGQPVNGDSVYDGANDDAAGTTAVIIPAKYFKTSNNERTLIFTAFTAEEEGGFGSQYFSKQLDPLKVKAMFNIEMIGTQSKWGNNSPYITGYEKSDMRKILQKNLESPSFKFYPDPYPEQTLFCRSDNVTLASLGVPARTISTSKNG